MDNIELSLEDDIVAIGTNKEFTDGIGKISSNLMENIQIELNLA